jgi:hypothetical protein
VCSLQFLLQKLYSVSKRIEDVDAFVSCEWFVRYRGKPRRAAPSRELRETAHPNCRVRFARRMKGPIHAEMKAQVAAAKPHATTAR